MMGLYELHGKDGEQCGVSKLPLNLYSTHNRKYRKQVPVQHRVLHLRLGAQPDPHRQRLLRYTPRSISKWIHLNGGDDAVMKIFNRVYMVLNHGVFVLEPQAWETYGKARKMDEKLRTNANTLP